MGANSTRRVIWGRGVERVETARVGEEAECWLCCARVAEQVGKGWCGAHYGIYSSAELTTASTPVIGDVVRT
jgi:hypothetical protein